MTTSPLGREVPRFEARLKVTGEAEYSADREATGVAHVHAHLVTSTIARGTVRSLDATEAEAMPGVLGVFSHLHRFRDPMVLEGGLAENYVPLQDSQVRFHGQVVALVVAETFEVARDAALSVRVTYDAAPHRASLDAGMPGFLPPPIPGFPLPPSRQLLAPGVASMEEAFEASDVVVEAEFHQYAQHHVAMEPHSTLAEWRNGHLTVYTGTQNPMRSAASLALRLDVPPETVRVISEHVGGGFGGRVMVWNDGALAAAAAREVGRPVKLVMTREQAFTVSPHRAEVRQTVRLGARRDGVLNALRHLTWTERPAVGGFPMMPAAETSAMMYATPNLHYAGNWVPMDMPPVAAMRGPHETPGSFALETAMDELAVELDLDPVELRRRNHAEAPPGGRPFSSKHLLECYQVGAERFGWSARRARPGSKVRGEWLHGTGMASAAYPAHRDPAQVRVTLRRDDTAVVSTATSDLGTGAWTMLAISGADALGIHLRQVTPQLGDSSLPPGAPAARSAATASSIPAVQAAAAQAVAELLRRAVSEPRSPYVGERVEDLRYEAGHVVGPDGVSRTFGRLLRSMGVPSVAVTAAAPRGPEAQQYSFYAFGAHFCEVRVNRFTGEPRVVRFTSVLDVGRAVNARALRSQLTGGIIYGIGHALLEHNPLEATTGRLAASNLADYMVPVNADVPDLDVHWLGVPDTVLNETGARGAGEIGTVGAAAAVGNAVFDATGVRVRELPITLDKLFESL